MLTVELAGQVPPGPLSVLKLAELAESLRATLAIDETVILLTLSLHHY